jgi:hypothetical protein
LADQPRDQISQRQEAQNHARQERHEARLGLRKTAEPEFQASPAHQKGEAHPHQIVDEKRLLQDQPQGNWNFPTSLPQKLLFLQPQFLHQPADLLRMPPEKFFLMLDIQAENRTEKKRILETVPKKK